jgi:hypothetical protein
VQLRVSPTERGARIDLVSDINLTGRIASLGRGVRDVSNRMFAQFAGQLADRVEHPEALAVPAGAVASPAGASVPAAAAGSGFRVEEHPSAPVRAASASTAPSSEMKVLPLVWGITRERFADFLDRLSRRVRPS